MFNLLDQLVASGLAAELAGWTLTEARAISDDARTIAGIGIDPDGNIQGWIATIDALVIPEPSTGLLFSVGLALLAHRRGSRARR